VLGGNTGENALASVELIFLGGEVEDSNCVAPPDFDEPRYRFGGAYFEGRARICGGYNDQTLETLSDCLEYVPEEDAWVAVDGLPYPARAFGSSMVNSETWFLTGGTDGDNFFSSTLVLRPGELWEPGPELPFELFFHSQVSQLRQANEYLLPTLESAPVNHSVSFTRAGRGPQYIFPRLKRFVNFTLVCIIITHSLLFAQGAPLVLYYYVLPHRSR